MSRITSAFLRKHGACEEEVALFIALGGDRLELTERLCLKHADKFNWDWAADNLLTKAAYDQYLTSRDIAWNRYCWHVRRWWWAFWGISGRDCKGYKCACARAFYRAWVSSENQDAEVAA